MSRQITYEEVKKHKSNKSVWMVIHNDVYDVTAFLEEHPGGADSLLEVAGQDGTQAFEDVGHSQDARELMKKFKIGTLPPGQQNTNIESCCRMASKKRSSCQRIPKAASTEKTWRTYDGSSSRSSMARKSDYKPPTSPRPERRVPAIIVPRERRPRGPPCGSSKLKWALLALAGAIVIGIVLKKYVAKS